MAYPASPLPPSTPLPFDTIADALVEHGYLVLPNALPDELAASLVEAGRESRASDFVVAGTGREAGHQVNQGVRSDKIAWLTGAPSAERDYLAIMEALRLGLNERLFLGLFDYECHFACYEPGACYKTHLDAFEGRRNRILSTVYYLNPDWTHGHGGELLLYERDARSLVRLVQPVYNTLVVFLSERFPHEVLPASRPRYSMAGWFRVNTSTADSVDPPA